jgi:hypothetical protein
MIKKDIKERNEEIAIMMGAIFSKHAKAWGFGNAVIMDKPIKFGGKEYDNVVSAQTFKKELNFHNDWNEIMDAILFINQLHKDNVEGRDFLYTIQYLMSGGYFPKSNEKCPKRLLNNIDNLFLAVSDFAKMFNNKKL